MNRRSDADPRNTLPGEHTRPLHGSLPARPVIAEDHGRPVGAAPAQVPVLRVIAGRDVLRFARLPVSGSILIGREPEAELCLSDPTVSRRHARLEVRGSEMELLDLDATNGTRVDGRLIARCRVRPGEVLEFGTVAARIDHLGEAELRHVEGVLARLNHAGLHAGTGLLPATWIDAELPALLVRSRDLGLPCVALLLVVDHTTTRGNPALEEGLADAIDIVGRLVLLSVRDTDACVRWQDDVLVVLDTTTEVAARVATRVRKVVNSQDWTRISPHLRLHARAVVAGALSSESAAEWLARLRHLATIGAP